MPTTLEPAPLQTGTSGLDLGRNMLEGKRTTKSSASSPQSQHTPTTKATPSSSTESVRLAAFKEHLASIGKPGATPVSRKHTHTNQSNDDMSEVTSGFTSPKSTRATLVSSTPSSASKRPNTFDQTSLFVEDDVKYENFIDLDETPSKKRRQSPPQNQEYSMYGRYQQPALNRNVTPPKTPQFKLPSAISSRGKGYMKPPFSHVSSRKASEFTTPSNSIRDRYPTVDRIGKEGAYTSSNGSNFRPQTHFSNGPATNVSNDQVAIINDLAAKVTQYHGLIEIVATRMNGLEVELKKEVAARRNLEAEVKALKARFTAGEEHVDNNLKNIIKGLNGRHDELEKRVQERDEETLHAIDQAGQPSAPVPGGSYGGTPFKQVEKTPGLFSDLVQSE